MGLIIGIDCALFNLIFTEVTKTLNMDIFIKHLGLKSSKLKVGKANYVSNSRANYG